MSVSSTTRKRRIGEIENIHYCFCNKEEFRKDIDNGMFFVTSNNPPETTKNVAKQILLAFMGC